MQQTLKLDSPAEQAAFLSLVDGFLRRGADLGRATALHFAVAISFPIRILHELALRGADLNVKDHNGMTPLMIAAMKEPGQVSRFNPVMDSNTISALISLGADKAMTNDEGCTALGVFYQVSRSFLDFQATFGIAREVPNRFDPILEALLMPPGGPTSADEAAKDHGENESNDRDDDDNDEGGDDDGDGDDY
jgi:hypothetical protein